MTRIDTSTRKVTATIPVGIPGVGGEICYGADSVWATKFGIPLTRIDTKANKVSRQWVGRGGDALRFGYDSIWLTVVFYPIRHGHAFYISEINQ